jgi:phosphatidylglycerol---prolipoprotein diacylglyceryl transferase
VFRILYSFLTTDRRPLTTFLGFIMWPTLFHIPLPSGLGVLWYYLVLGCAAAIFNALTTYFGAPSAHGRPPRSEILKSAVWGLVVGLVLAAVAHYYHRHSEQEFLALEREVRADKAAIEKDHRGGFRTDADLKEAQQRDLRLQQYRFHPFFLVDGRPQGIPVYSFGAMLALGAVVTMALTVRRVRRNNTLNPETAIDLALVVFLAGVLGARVLFFLEYPDRFGQDSGSKFLDLLMIWKGGLIFYGGMAGAIVAVVFFTRWRLKGPWVDTLDADRPSVFRVLDLCAPATALGQAFGRVGCFLNGCCWGAHTDLPWGVEFPHGSYAFKQHVDLKWINETAACSLPVHPTQLYEAGYLLLTYLFLEWMYYRRRRFDGRIACLLLIIYPVLRFINEYLRNDNPPFYNDLRQWMPNLLGNWPRGWWMMDPQSVFGGVSGSQVISVGLLILGASGYFWLSGRARVMASVPTAELRVPGEE